jgi:fructuronate reductase
MVDRIVPATTDEDRAAIDRALGLQDAWPVMAEPFTQFVVEDTFTLGRPDWEAHGVTMAEDVEPFEKMKLRMLNGSHSTLAYLGYLAGDETVADTMADPAFKRLIGDLMAKEIKPTLSMPPDVDLVAYGDALLERFSNTALKHRTWQIAMDGSQKLPQRLLGTIRDRLEAGQPFDRLALGVAAWMRYALGTDEQGKAIDVRDPMADDICHNTRDQCD